MKRFMLALAVCVALRAADDDAKTAIMKLISDNFKAIQSAKTKDDIARAVDAIDVREWVSELPDGQTRTRADALRELEEVLAVPPEKRGFPKLDFIYGNETAAQVTCLYWVYREADGGLIGSIARDTWVRTPAGWRRTRHEKFLPERPLIQNGKAVILPQPI